MEAKLQVNGEAAVEQMLEGGLNALEGREDEDGEAEDDDGEKNKGKGKKRKDENKDKEPDGKKKRRSKEDGAGRWAC